MSPGTFWNYVGGVDQVETYDSLDAIVGASDLIVVATIEGLGAGREIEFPETDEIMQMAELGATITEVLHGTPISPSGETETIVVEKMYGFAPNPDRLRMLQESTPVGSRVLLFLVNKAADAVRHGFEPEAVHADEQFYLLLRGDQAAIRDDDGTARIGADGDGKPDWVADLDGRPFDEVVAEIKDAIASS